MMRCRTGIARIRRSVRYGSAPACRLHTGSTRRYQPPAPRPSGSPSPAFDNAGPPPYLSRKAQVAELVDALVSGTSAARRGGSSPLLGTILLRADALRRIAPLKIAKQDALRSLLAADVRLRTKAAGGGGLPECVTS